MGSAKGRHRCLQLNLEGFIDPRNVSFLCTIYVLFTSLVDVLIFQLKVAGEDLRSGQLNLPKNGLIKCIETVIRFTVKSATIFVLISLGTVRENGVYSKSRMSADSGGYSAG